MARPSIFSKDYERHKRRRRKVTVFAVVFILAAAGIVLIGSGIKDKLISKASAYKNIKLFSVFKKEKIDEVVPSNVEDKPAVQEPENNPAPEEETVEKSYEVPLADGTKIRAVYENKDEVNKFKYVIPLNAPVTFNINPSGSAMVILDSSVQNMLLVDINGKVDNITNTKYVYTNPEENTTVIFKKDEVLERYKQYNYVWCTSPKFIDDENIAYTSQLPYVSSKRNEQFLWAVNIKKKDRHIYKYSLNGLKLKLGNTTEKGIELFIDNGPVRFVKLVDGEIKVTD